jgi:hypothetical protein
MASELGMVADRNVLGGPLEPCGTDPLTGFYRDGCCSTGPEDRGLHTVCAVVTAEFLDHQKSIGNDLSTPMPQYRFPGLVPGDRWCVTARNWLLAYHDECAAPVVLASTHERTLDDARRRLSSHKLPREIYVVDQVPRAPNGKANYPAARELFLAGRREQSS